MNFQMTVYCIFTGLTETTTTLTGQVLGLEVSVTELDQRVGEIEAGGGGNANVASTLRFD